jgi:hypothetical protein
MPINTSLALVSLTDAKAFLKITNAGEDTIIGDIVNHCSAWINKYCNRVFLETVWTEYHDGDSGNDDYDRSGALGHGVIMLRQFPVSAVSSMYEDTLHVFGTTTLVDAGNYYFNPDTGELTLFNQRLRFIDGTQSIKVTYTAGYPLASMPSDIQMACKLLAAYVYRNMYSQWKIGVASETIGTKTTTFDKAEMPKEVVGILRPYRKLTVGCY